MYLTDFTRSLGITVQENALNEALAAALRYLADRRGTFWLFQNSDVALDQELDGAQYLYGGRGLERPEKLLRFSVTDYRVWKNRVEDQRGLLTEEEERNLLALGLPKTEMHRVYAWAALLFVASPHMEEWRRKNNSLYAFVKENGGCAYEYMGRTIREEDLELWGHTQPEDMSCELCGEFLPCLEFSPISQLICGSCMADTGETCPHHHGCHVVFCNHNPERFTPVEALGRRFA